MRPIRLLIFVMSVVFMVSGLHAQAQELIAPNIFLRGTLLPAGVRYTATFIRPAEDMVLRNVSAEITLPPSAQLNQMLVSRQIQFDVVRVSRERAITMIWQTSRINGDQLVDTFSFLLSQPLSEEVEFYLEWQDENGVQFHESFFEVPPLSIATVSSGEALVPAGSAFTPIGFTGVQASTSHIEPVTVTANILPADFNPPAEFGDVWWCSILELVGLPEGVGATVIVPLRRPVAPFTPLSMFKQNPDGTWSPLDAVATVTADGQFALYEHTGGIIATGGEAEIQPETVDASTLQPLADAGIVATPLLANVGTEEILNSIPIVGNVVPEGLTDGTSNTVTVGEIPVVGDGGVQPVPEGVTDGTSNTVIVGEIPVVGDGGVQPVPEGLTDGTSNTVIVGEIPVVAVTLTPTGEDPARPTAIVAPPVTLTPTVENTARPTTVIVPPVTLTPTVENTARPTTVIAPPVTLTPTGEDPTRPTAIIAPPVTLTPTVENTARSTTVIVPPVTLTPTGEDPARPTAIVAPPVTLTPTGEDPARPTAIVAPLVTLTPTVEDPAPTAVIVVPVTLTPTVEDPARPTPVFAEPTIAVSILSEGVPAEATELINVETVSLEATAVPQERVVEPTELPPTEDVAVPSSLEIDVGSAIQCQRPQINCAVLVRRPGNGFR